MQFLRSEKENFIIQVNKTDYSSNRKLTLENIKHFSNFLHHVLTKTLLLIKK